MRQSGDQIDVDVRDSSGVQAGDIVQDCLTLVKAPHQGSLFINKRLDTQTHAVHAAPDERVLIEQGIEMQRPSRIFVCASFQENLKNDLRDNRIVNVRVGGNAIEVMRGELFL